MRFRAAETAMLDGDRLPDGRYHWPDKPVAPADSATKFGASRTGALKAATLGGVLLLAFAVRLVPVLFHPSFNAADEVFQSLEQAHRLVYGTGLVPWEFQLGIRSWLLPGAIAALMEVARLFGTGPAYYLPVIYGACGCLAVVPVLCCFLWCRRWFGFPAAIVGSLCVAFAPELVLMGDRTLSEVVAAHVLVVGLYLVDPGYRTDSRARLFWAGAALMLAFVLRVQLAPAVALIGLWAAWRLRRECLPGVAGAGAVFACAALLDTFTLGSPAASIWRYILCNLYYGVSSTFGTEPWYFYALFELAIWGSGLCILINLAILGTGRTWLPLAAALAILAAHSAIGHKEYRFIYPAVVLLSVQAGIGLALATDYVGRKLAALGPRGKLAGSAVPGLAALLWCALSLSTWERPLLVKLRGVGHDDILAASYLARDPSVCGIGIYGHDAWSWYGGYSYLNRPVPMYRKETERQLWTSPEAFNVILYSIAPKIIRPVLPPGFATARCFGEACIARRPGTCIPEPMPPLPYPEPLASFARR